MKTVLHLIDEGGPGGAQTVFIDLATRLDRSGWQHFACVPSTGWVYDRLRERGVEPILTPIKRGSFDVRYLVWLIALIRTHRIDLVHGHLLGPGVYGSLAGLITRVPVITTFHGQVDVSPKERFRGLKFGIINRAAGSVVFVSEHLRQLLLSATHLNPDRTAVVHNGVDFAAFGPDADRSFRAELGVGSEEILVGAVGHIRPPKAYEVFLRAAAQLRTASRAFRFVIVGQPEGNLLDELSVLREQLGLREAVTFAGFRPDIHHVISGLDVYVITSTSEGFSLSAVQAMACGVPVVATRCGGPEEIITDGETGLLVEVGLPDAIARAVLRLSQDPGVRRQLAHAGQVSVRQRFSLERMLEGYRALYERCVRRKGR